MAEIIKGVGEYGILVMIAVLFLYEHFATNKKMLETQNQNANILKEMQVTNQNTSKALEIIQTNQKHNIVVTERIEKKIDCIKEKAEIIKKEV